jgi:hypothetical protein
MLGKVDRSCTEVMVVDGDCGRKSAPGWALGMGGRMVGVLFRLAALLVTIAAFWHLALLVLTMFSSTILFLTTSSSIY